MKKIIKKLFICLILILILCLSFFFEKPIYNFLNKKVADIEKQLSNSKFQIHFVDVGQADAIAIKLPNNKTMLIDSGLSETSEKLVKYLEKYILGESKVIDYFIITHPHLDHCGGAEKVFACFDIKNFFTPYVSADAINNENIDYNINQFKNLISYAKSETLCQITYVDYTTENILGDDFLIEFLSPFDIVSTINDFSPLILITYNSRKFLFTGDAEEFTEQKVLSYYQDKLKNVDVLKVGHHGSKTSSSADFVNFLMPEYSIISVGRNNEYSHPNQHVINRLKENGIDVGNNIYTVEAATKAILRYLENKHRK